MCNKKGREKRFFFYSQTENFPFIPRFIFVLHCRGRGYRFYHHRVLGLLLSVAAYR